MFAVLIENKPVLIKKGSSFEFISENNLFTDAEGYTLNIAFPLRGCRQNLDVFGSINRHGHRVQGRPFDMEIVCPGVRLKGVGVITSISDIECSVQFLSGRSAENYYSDLEEVYINNLDIGEVPMEYREASQVSVFRAWGGHPWGMEMVALPFVNEGTGHIINNTAYDPNIARDQFSDGSDQVWVKPEEAESVPGYVMMLSWFPYLIEMARKICDAIGFSHDFSQWQASKWHHLLLCNAVPGTWDFRWNLLLPRWSVIEFFRKLEPLLEGSFDIDLIERKISFTFYECTIFSKLEEIDNVLDEFTSEVFEEDEECKLLSERFMGYSFRDSKAALPYSCEWFMRYRQSYFKSYPTPEDVKKDADANKWSLYARGGLRGQNMGDYIHVESVNRYASARVGFKEHGDYVIDVFRMPIMLDAFGPRNAPAKDSSLDSLDYSIEFVPVVIDDTDHRRMMFIPLGEYDEGYDEPMLGEDDQGNYLKKDIYDSFTMRMLEKGRDDGSTAYFDNIAVGFYPSARLCSRGGNEIYPITDNFEFGFGWEPWQAINKELTLSLHDSDGKFAAFPKIDRQAKFEFSFLSNRLPDVNSVFLIRSQRYLCEKLTVTFTESGMSQKIKGTFWRISD